MRFRNALSKCFLKNNNTKVLDNLGLEKCFLLFGKVRTKTSELDKAVAVVPSNALKRVF